MPHTHTHSHSLIQSNYDVDGSDDHDEKKINNINYIDIYFLCERVSE